MSAGGAAGDRAVTVVGDRRVTVPATVEESGPLAVETIDRSFRCSSGEPIPGPWTGYRVADLLAAAGAPPATTHVAIEGRDGFRVCVPVGAALDGLLALRRGSRGSGTDLPRFVAPAVAGTRTVKRVARLEAVALDAGDDPAALEELQPGEEG